MLKTRKMVHLSYVNELKRLSCEESKQEEQQVLKTEESKATLKDAGLKKKKTVRKKSKEPVHKYDNVKSRLFQSIEATRAKEQKKYVNPDIA